MLYLAELKKPHRVFNQGDLVVCSVWNGQGTNFLCGGWSTKLNRIVARYVMRYQGTKDGRTPQGNWQLLKTGQGHLRLLARDDTRLVTTDRLGWLCYEPPEEGWYPDQRSFLRQLTGAFWRELAAEGGAPPRLPPFLSDRAG